MPRRLRPEDIDLPRTPRDPGVTARPTSVRAKPLRDPRGQALGELSDATRRYGAQVEQTGKEYAAQGGRKARALREKAGAVAAKGDAEYAAAATGVEARVQVARARAGEASALGSVASAYAAEASAKAQFATSVNGITDVFLELKEKRDRIQGQQWRNEVELEYTKRSAAVVDAFVTSPPEGPQAVEAFDQNLSQLWDQIAEEKAAARGYTPPEEVYLDAKTGNYRSRISAIEYGVRAQNNEQARQIYEDAESTMLEVAREAAASGDLTGALRQVDEIANGLGPKDGAPGLLGGQHLAAVKKAGRAAVYASVIRGHLARGDTQQARRIVDLLTGVAGTGGNDITTAVLNAAKNEGTNPVLLLAIGRHESGLDPTAKNPSSSAAGLFQQVKKTSQHYNGVADASTLHYQDQAKSGARMLRTHEQEARQILKAEPTPESVFAVHFLGMGRAGDLLLASPYSSLKDVLPAKVIKGVFPERFMADGVTVADARAWIQSTAQNNMEAVVADGLVAGVQVGPTDAGLPIDKAYSLSREVAVAEEKQLKAYEKRQKQFATDFGKVTPWKDRDPAQFVYDDADPIVRNQFARTAAVMQDENATPKDKQAAFAEQVRVTTEAQTKYGIGERDAKILPVAHAKQVVGELTEAQGAEALTKFYQWRDLAGEHFPRLYRELVAAGLPGGDFQLASQIDPRRDTIENNLLSQVVNVPIETLKANLEQQGNSPAGEIEKAVNESMQDWRAVMGFGFGGMGAQQTADVMTAINKVALAHYRLPGSNSSVADSVRVATGIVLNKMEVMEGSHYKVAMPTSYGLSESNIEAVTDFKLKPDQVSGFDPMPFEAPRPMSGVEESLTPEERRIVQYHRDNLWTGKGGTDDKGKTVTVASVGLKVQEGPLKGKFVSVPAFIDGDIVRDENGKVDQEAVYAYWKAEIEAGQWPVYDSGKALNARSKQIHTIMDEDADEYAFRKEQTLTAMQNGVWTRNAKGDGLVLRVSSGQNGLSWSIVRNAEGEPYEILFEDMPSMLRTMPRMGAQGIRKTVADMQARGGNPDTANPGGGIRKTVLEMQAKTASSKKKDEPLVPVNIRQFVSHLLGDRSPLTEEHLSSRDMESLRSAVSRQVKEGKTSGVIGYGDYGSAPGQFSSFGSPYQSGQSIPSMVAESYSDPKFRMETTIGMAKWHKDKNGNIIIEDNYNFNATRKQVEAALKDESIAGVLVNAYSGNGIVGLVNAMGNIFGSTDDEGGNRVRINLGKV